MLAVLVNYEARQGGGVGGGEPLRPHHVPTLLDFAPHRRVFAAAVTSVAAAADGADEGDTVIQLSALH